MEFKDRSRKTKEQLQKEIIDYLKTPVEEYSKEDMTDEQRSLFDDLLALQKRCVEIEQMAREFADKKQLVDLKSQSLLESLRGIGNAEKESDSETKISD